MRKCDVLSVSRNPSSITGRRSSGKPAGLRGVYSVLPSVTSCAFVFTFEREVEFECQFECKFELALQLAFELKFEFKFEFKFEVGVEVEVECELATLPSRALPTPKIRS